MSSPVSLVRARALLLVIGCAALAGCASTGATFRSGVGDAYLEQAPWYAGSALAGYALAGYALAGYALAG
jgi:hypothetical protein